MNLRRIANRALAVTAVMAVAAGLWSGPAGAQAAAATPEAGSSFGIRAGEHGRTTLEEDHFAYDVPAGTSIEDSVILVNHTDKALQLRLYAADLISAAGGGFAPAQADAVNKGVGRWARLESSIVDLAPSATEEVAFRVEVPDGTTPGEHPGAIVASTVAAKADTGLAVETRAALIARVRVPGELLPDLSLGVLRSHPDGDGGRTFSVTVTNPGNVLLEVPGEVRIDSGGTEVTRLALSPRDTYVIPGGETTLTARWDNPPMLGRFVAQAVVTAELDGETTGTYLSAPTALTLFPLLMTGIVLAVAATLLGFWIATRGVRTRRREAKQRQLALLEEVSQLLAQRRTSRSRRSEVSRPTRGGARPPHHRDRRATIDPLAHRSPKPRRSSAPR